MPALCAPFYGEAGSCHIGFTNCIPGAQDIYRRAHDYYARKEVSGLSKCSQCIQCSRSIHCLT
jgi:hypothetical protein